MKKLTIEWRHIEKDGKTCDRCSNTKRAIKTVIAKLRQRGVQTTLREVRLSTADVSLSNMILLNGVPLEQLIPDVQATATPCASCSCLTGRQEQCRALITEHGVYEDIPSEVLSAAAFQAIGDF